jgi:hypothetical protein
MAINKKSRYDATGSQPHSLVSGLENDFPYLVTLQDNGCSSRLGLLENPKLRIIFALAARGTIQLCCFGQVFHQVPTCSLNRRTKLTFSRRSLFYFG